MFGKSYQRCLVALGGLAALLIPSMAFAQSGDGANGQSTILTWATFLPTLGALAIVLIPNRLKHTYKYIALGAAAASFVLCLQVFLGFDASVVVDGAALKGKAPTLEYGSYGLQYVHHVTWIKSFGIEYFVGVDGISTVMVLLSGAVSFIAILASFLVRKPVDPEKGYLSGIQKNEKAYYALILLLATGMLGVFVAMDLFLFYVFWEVMLLPMYFLIGIWGGPRKEYAAIKFFLYTLAGSLAMLIAFIFIYLNSTPDGGGSYILADGSATEHTFNIMYLSYSSTTAWTELFTSKLAWILLFVGFAIKVPMFPFHTWLPDAHVQAPTPISVILAGVLLKMGTYGMLRFNWQLLPEATAEFGTMVCALGLVGILWGAYCAMAQSDLKRLVAYSSVSHMGFVLFGMGTLTSEGINGGVFQMFSHGLVTSMLFLLVGVVYDRAHHRNIDGFGGLAKVVPAYTGFIGLAFMASLGLPGLSGFIGEVMVFVGGFKTQPVLTTFAVTSVIITAGYMLWALQRVFLGPLNEKYENLTDMNWREWATLVPLGIPVIIFGVYPMPILDSFSGALTNLNDYVMAHADIATEATKVVSLF